MRFKSLIAGGALMALAAAPVQAQRAGVVEIGGFGRFTKFDSHLNFDDRGGFGGRLGFFVLRNLEVEGDISLTPTYSVNQDYIRYTPIHARLLYNIPFSQYYALILGGGYTHNSFSRSYSEKASGFGGLAGLRLGLGDVMSVRLDATGDYISSPESGKTPPPSLAGVRATDKNWHWGAQAGLSFLIGAKRDGDRDRDGVKDSADRCPNTPAGDRVDASGCSLPKDADGDGVTDDIDRCPNTPAGTAVDATGCPLPTDADRDGVVDANDRCPNTPAGMKVDATGCPLDSDRDGVPDTLDACPNTPAGEKVDTRGCPPDSDNDGVTDANDRCPNTPAGDAVDANGCSLQKDADNDGVPDDKDRCPDTPAGTKVDAVGCTALFNTGTPLVLQGVFFETGKATLRPESQAKLDVVAASLNDNPDVNVEVGGHTDNTGSRATNLRLSQARADAVKAYLVSKGVDAGRITTKGYGPDSPVADNTTAAGRTANRRVELTRTN